MARVPPPRHDVDRGLWIPDLRKGSFSPLRSCQSSLPASCPSQRLPTPRLRRCDLSVTFPIRFPPCAGGSSQSSSQSSHVAHVVERKQRDVHVAIYDTVLLEAMPSTSWAYPTSEFCTPIKKHQWGALGFCHEVIGQPWKIRGARPFGPAQGFRVLILLYNEGLENRVLTWPSVGSSSSRAYCWPAPTARPWWRAGSPSMRWEHIV